MKILLFHLATLMLIFTTQTNAQIKVHPDKNVTIGLITPSEKFEVDGSINVRGNQILVGSEAENDHVNIKLGLGRTVNGNAFFDLISDASIYPTYGFKSF